jgi:hypothetical protein
VTPLTWRASAPAADFASSDGTVPKSVTTPFQVSTLIASAGVLLSASKRAFVSVVIHMSFVAPTTPRSAPEVGGEGFRQSSSSVSA